MVERYLQILNISLEAVFNNKFRSILTALGIIFGVAAVIAMMAIGNGARLEILNQIKMVGVNNIVIIPLKQNGKENKQAEDEEEGKSLKKKYSPGLTLKDAENIMANIPTVERVSPEVDYPVLAIRSGNKMNVDLSGVTNVFFELFNLDLLEGTFFKPQQMKNGDPVCIIGPEVKARLFPKENPIGKNLKCGNVWFKVIGILKGVKVSEKVESLGVSDYNKMVFAPIKTVLLRFKDRSLINQASLGGTEVFYSGNSVMITEKEGSGGGENQLDKIVVQVKDTKHLATTADVIARMLQRRHRGVEDFEIKIPELLLKQEQKTRDIFNIVLGAIAGISLIVGGIGIMNIMLASVLERIREIGIRRATGATRKDIVFQFLAEATFISITGGLFGIILGVVMAKVISTTTGILTVISFPSILVSFVVAAAVGIIFGYLPAKKASEQDPLESLRHD
ncbi:MAG: FtsX-like permease family protein [Chlorobi bacterium]|nr:FtsX-like permease family protein [Chlorobiota bacterium]